MSISRKPYKTFTKEFKLEAVRLMSESNQPAAEIAVELGIRRNSRLNKTPMITSSQKNSFAIYYDGCLVNYALIGRNLNIAADFRQVFFS
jgi:hypothetical protein